MERVSRNQLHITLPFGLIDRQGRRHRSAELVPINGWGELSSAQEPNPFRAVIQLITHSVVRLGPFSSKELDLALLNGLSPLDRDYLAIQLNRMTFGDLQYQKVTCTEKDCSEAMDVQVDLSTVEATKLPNASPIVLNLGEDRTIRLRPPTAGDQLILSETSNDRQALTLLARCLLPNNSDAPSLSHLELQSLSEEVRSQALEALLEAAPGLDLTLELECIKCKRPFVYEYDPVRRLHALLSRSRRALLKEIHYLAFYYHWSHDDILKLSRSLRREYLALLEAELSTSSDGGLAL